MSFNNFSSNIKLNNIKAYSGVNTATNDAFKKQVYSDIEDIDYGSYEEVDYNAINLQEGIEKAEANKNQKEWYEEIIDLDKKLKATACVTATSVASGVLKIGEYAADGLTWLGGMAVSGVARLFGQKEFAEDFEEMTMDEIARDKVGEMNEFFYENTELGKAINDASALKYNSELAKGIQNVTTEAAIIVGATAATVVTGGAAAPLFAAGFVVGAGQSAEKNYQDVENRDFWKDSAEIAVDGTIKGLSTVAYGKAGAAAVNGVKTLGKLGLSGVKEMGKQAISSVSKESLKQTAKQSGKIALKTAGQTLIDKDTWRETGAVLLNDIKTGVQTGEWDVLKMVGDAALIYGENYIGNLAGNVVGDIISGTKNNVDIKFSEQKPTQQLPTQVNSVTDYKFDRGSTIDYICDLKNQGYTDNQIIEMFADYGSSCSDYVNKRAFADISYEFLLSTGYSPEDAADILIDVYNKQLVSRGMNQVFVDNNGIKYNYLNNFNPDNQAYSIKYVMEQINELPEDVRKTITEVNFYDTFNPADYYWQARYKSDGSSIFQSAATAGDGQINIWSNEFVSDGVIAHEAGHCFDVGGQYSGSQEYLEAIWRDSQLTGKQSITDYGGNNPAEDFAETMAAYKNGYVLDGNGGYSSIDEFPHRKMFIEKNMKVDGQQYLSIFDMNQLNEVTGSLINDHGQEQALWAFYNYLSTGDVNNIPLPSSAKELVANIDINEVVEYYNLWNGEFSK